jgi:hypothetical protein
LTPGTAQLLSRMIEAKLAFLISGGTGSGKPTLGLPHTNWVGPARSCTSATGGLAGMEVPPSHGKWLVLQFPVRSVWNVHAEEARHAPIEAMVAVVIAGVIGWLVFRAFFAAGDRLQRVRTDPTQSAALPARRLLAFSS